jgi:ectoine hydroxylase-related dioxygenase (phytanoyl-CoA dioxygenase family)
MGVVRTLERIHGPITAAFPRLRSSDDVGRFRLSDETCARFERDGYVAGLPILDREQVALLRERLEGLQRRIHDLTPHLYEVEEAWLRNPDSVVFHMLGAWKVDSLFHDVLFHPAVTVPLVQLLGVRRLRFWHDQVFAKPPRHQGVVPWHQDYSYWTRTVPCAHLTMNIVLDDTTEESGCLEVMPGTQDWPLLPRVAFDAPRDAVFAGVSPERLAALRAVPVPLSAGQGSIHHPFLIHGSGPNRGASPRRAIVINVMAPWVRVADGREPLLRGVASIPEGRWVHGDHFPVLLQLPIPTVDGRAAGPSS